MPQGSKVVPASEAVKMVVDGDIVAVNSSSGLCCPDAVLAALGVCAPLAALLVVRWHQANFSPRALPGARSHSNATQPRPVRRIQVVEQFRN